MLFWLSKTLWIFVQPLNLFLIIVLSGSLLYFFSRSKLGLRLVFFGIAGLVIVAVFPIGSFLSRPLENRFPIPNLDQQVDGIIVLGGSEQTSITHDRKQLSLNGAAERLILFVDLANRFPNGALAYSGGSGSLKPNALLEADIASDIFSIMNLDLNRVIFEKRARNTYENAVFTKKLVQPQTEENWILITSALAMPRAVGSFRKAGWKVIPYPVDYRSLTESRKLTTSFGLAKGGYNLNHAVHEWVGLGAYYLLNRTDSLFPAPGPAK